MHLECWLNKVRVEIVAWAAVGVARQNVSSVNEIDVDSIRIRCASGECEFNSHSNRIKCERTFKYQSLTDRRGPSLVPVN